MYEKLAHDGCHCLCSYTHPDNAGICATTADGDVLATLFNEPVNIPMCRPCADAYQARYMSKAGKSYAEN